MTRRHFFPEGSLRRREHTRGVYLRVKEASALVYDCSDENVENAAPHFGHGKENPRQGRVAYVDVPVGGISEILRRERSSLRGCCDKATHR